MKKTQDFISDGIYKGQMKNGVPHGKGTYTSKFETKSRKKNKYFYKGDWVNGKKHGKAEHAYHLPAYAVTFKGTYKNDLPHGHGVLIMKYKGKLEEKYIGEFKKGYRHGKGKLINYFQKWTKEGTFSKRGFKK
jgi:hypothetical protein